VAKVEVQRDMKREAIGWISITLIMVLFPVLFFVCAYAPMWLGIDGAGP
jgi:hypothetical protein